MQRPKKPTHASVTRFIASIIPPKANDVPFLYHVPRDPRYDPETAAVEQIVLSVTPTPAVYKLIGYPHDVDNEPNAELTAPPPRSPRPRPPRTLCFLHRPFTLDRRAIRANTLIFSSHTSFDEVLTVGYNTALASRLGILLDTSICVQGYKGDAERKIGIVGEVAAPQQRDVLVRRIQQVFGGTTEELLVHEGAEEEEEEIRVVAIMNAFGEDEVRRVVELVKERGWCGDGGEDGDEDGRVGKHMLYLTGQPRVGGMQAATALGMTVVCVGHRAAEEWGIRYLAQGLRTAFPGVRVEDVYEEEIPVVREKKKKVAV
ncbi:hypothetical protein N0V83_002783 [Neocucurbitaria cava]|uniref:Uncharacterized protein n=1 Tax=Neocucurbitaria cava TaxID=798079 RepID=A0A9W9CPZ0_9PLEO|nr:hypothetical protein N0V83_002783 [Neocucurbitaria cava]